MKHTTTYLLGGKDLEMTTIKNVLDKNDIDYQDKGLGRGAKMDAYADEAKSLLSEGKNVVGIELIGASEGEFEAVESIDHHGDRSHEPAAILQVLSKEGITPTMYHRLVAANDSGFILGMKQLLDTETEYSEEVKSKIIQVIRKKDRTSQGITAEQEQQAEEAIKSKEVFEDIGLVVVKLPHSKCATVTDRLYGKYKNLLVLSDDGEVNFYWNGKLCADLKEKFEGRNGGEDIGKEGDKAFRGGYPNHEEVQKFILEYLGENNKNAVESMPEVIDEKGVLSIKGLATALGMKEELVKLPNGKEIMSLVWKPEHLPQVFDIINKSKIKNTLGKNDAVIIDGVCPTWLLPTISHALHPVATAVTYPQGGPDVILPLSGSEIAKEGSAEGVKFTVTEDEEKTSVAFELTDASIDVQKAMQTLVAPEVVAGKPVFISGRGPIAIATALAESYAHKVPFVACFQPGTGRVVCISHSDTQLGTIFA